MKLTDYLAIYAAFLSTIVAVRNILVSRPKIRVRLIFSVEDVRGEPKGGLGVFIMNVSSQKIHLGGMSILYPYSTVSIKARLAHMWKYKRIPKRINWVSTAPQFYSVETGLPMSLEASSSHHVFFPESVIQGILSDAAERKLMASVQDQLWKDTYSNIYEWDMPADVKS